MQGPSCSTLTLILKNQRRIKSFVKPQEDIECYLEKWWTIFLKLQLEIRQEQFPSVEI